MKNLYISAGLAPLLTKFALAGIIMIIALNSMVVKAQTPPTAQTLPFSVNFGTTTFSAATTGTSAWTVSSSGKGSQSEAESSTENGNATINTATTALQTGGCYGYATSSNGRFYIQTSTNGTNGTSQLAASIITIGKQNITVSYTVEMISAQQGSAGVVLQYRLGTSGSWTTVDGTVYLHNTDRSNGQIDNYFGIALPVAAENVAVVQLRWATWRTSGSSSSGIAIDNITINSAGPTGPTGATGPVGPTGQTGATGSQGVQGEQGLRGEVGVTGVQGATGIQGVRGDDGAAGTAGSLDAWGFNGATGTNPTTHFIGTTDNADVVFKTNSTEAMRISADGKLGIGTNPTEKLDVLGNAKISGDLKISSLANDGYTMVFADANGNLRKQPDPSPFCLSYVTPWVLGGNNIFTADNNNRLGTCTSNDFALITNSSPRITIKADGKIGIGDMPSQNTKLKIKSDGAGSSANTVALEIVDANAQNLFIVGDDGSVLIGANAPYAKLGVDGDVKISSLGGHGDGAFVKVGADGLLTSVAAGSAGSGLWTLNLTNQHDINYNDGNVGIGIDPTTKFDVLGNAHIDGDLAITGNLTGGNVRLLTNEAFTNIHAANQVKVGNSIWIDGSNGATNIRNDIYTTTGEHLYIQSKTSIPNNTIINYENEGLVGIGTNTPTAYAKLDVKANFADAADQTVYGIKAVATGGISNYGIEATGSSAGVWGKSGSNGLAIYGYAVGSGIGGYFRSSSGDAGVFEAEADGTAGSFYSATGYGLVVRSGNVLINKTTQTSEESNFKLDVTGTLASTSLAVNNSGTAANQWGMVMKNNNGGEGLVITNSNISTNARALLVENVNGSISTPIFMVSAGTGITYAKKIIVSTDAWYDNVFDGDFKLMPLKEVENYISKNNHLPEVPSTAEVIKNGIELGAMDATLLKKIEELTLYVIEQNKKLEALQQENAEIKKVIYQK